MSDAAITIFNTLTNRQELILETLIDEYIKNAFPISSDFLKCECDLDVSPATIRIDLAKLTSDGFLEKLHISGGRVPTDRGYRFFVNKIIAKNKQKPAQSPSGIGAGKREKQKILKALNNFQKAAKALAESSANLSVVCDNNDIFWKEGWHNLIKSPEFQDVNLFHEFAELVDHFEENIEKISFDKEEKIKVFIGKESPFLEKDFSIIVAKPIQGSNLTLAILGPKRMNFKKNIQLINKIIYG